MDAKEPLKDSKRRSNGTSQVDTDSQFMSPRKSMICSEMKFLPPDRQALQASGVNSRGSPLPNSGESLHASQSHWDSDISLGILTTGCPVPSPNMSQERSHSRPSTLGVKTNISTAPQS